MSPKILLEKNKERRNRKSVEKESRRRKNDCPLSFYVHFFGEESFILAVTLIKNPARYIFSYIVANRNPIKKEAL